MWYSYFSPEQLARLEVKEAFFHLYQHILRTAEISKSSWIIWAATTNFQKMPDWSQQMLFQCIHTNIDRNQGLKVFRSFLKKLKSESESNLPPNFDIDMIVEAARLVMRWNLFECGDCCFKHLISKCSNWHLSCDAVGNNLFLLTWKAQSNPNLHLQNAVTGGIYWRYISTEVCYMEETTASLLINGSNLAAW